MQTMAVQLLLLSLASILAMAMQIERNRKRMRAAVLQLIASRGAPRAKLFPKRRVKLQLAAVSRVKAQAAQRRIV